MLPYLRKSPNYFWALVSPSHLTLIALYSVTQLDDSRNYMTPLIKNFSSLHLSERWHAVAQLNEALRYKPEGRGIDS